MIRLFFFVFYLLYNPIFFAKPIEKKPEAPKKEPPIHFQGDEMQGTRKDGFLELLREVKIDQGDFHLEAEKAQMFFDPKNEEIEKFLAFGKVKMNTKDEKTGEKVYAEGDEAEFYPKSNLLILKEHAMLNRGMDQMKGQRIEYNRQTGWIKGSKVQGKVENK